MFTRVPLVLAALVAATAIAAACQPPFPLAPPFEDFPTLPKKPAVSPFPQMGTIISLNGKEATIEYTVVVPVLVRETIRTNPIRVTDDGGKTWEPVWKKTTIYHWQYKQITRKSKIDRLKFSDATGQPVAILDAWKRLEIGTKFFVSADGNPVLAEHLKLIGRDVLVVVDFDNVTLERLIQDLESGAIEQWPAPKPSLPRTDPLPEPQG